MDAFLTKKARQAFQFAIIALSFIVTCVGQNQYSADYILLHATNPDTNSNLTFGNFPRAGFAPNTSPSGAAVLYFDNTATCLKVSNNGGAYACIGGGVGSGWPSTSSGWFDVKAIYGAAGDGSTDDSTAVSNAITAAMGATGGGTGGTIYFPPGKYRINSCLTLPNNGAPAPANQPALILRGAGAHMATTGSTLVAPTGGTILDLRCNPASGGKITSFGQSSLEIEDMTLEDLGADSGAFVYVTNTALHIHDVTFYGTAAGASAVNDAIILGGTTTSITNDATGGFQGYGTVIDRNLFRQIKRALVLRVFANNVQFTNNTIGIDSGNTTGGCVEILPGAGGTIRGNMIEHNLFEVKFYKYGVYGASGAGFSAYINGFWDGDTAANFVAPYRFDSGAGGNTIFDTNRSTDTFPCMSTGNPVDGNSCFTSHAGQHSLFQQPIDFGGGIGNWKGVATAGQGLSPIWGNNEVVNVSVAQSGLTVCNVPAGLPGVYQITWAATVTQAATTSSTLGGANGFQVIYTDKDTATSVTTPAWWGSGNNGVAPTSVSGNTVGTQAGGVIAVTATANTAITYNFGYTSSGATPMKYALHYSCVGPLEP